ARVATTRPSAQLSPTRAASVRRHPASMRRPMPAVCTRCGFRPLDRDDLVAEVASIPARWRPALADASADRREGAARLRDELHVVANRIRRLRAVPGTSLLAAVSVDPTTALSRTSNTAHLLAMVAVSSE